MARNKDYIYSCLQRFVISEESFCFFLPHLLSFHHLQMAPCFEEQNEKCKGNESDARTQDYSDGNKRNNLCMFKKLKTLRSELSSNNIWVWHGKFNRH